MFLVVIVIVVVIAVRTRTHMPSGDAPWLAAYAALLSLPHMPHMHAHACMHTQKHMATHINGETHENNSNP